MEAEELSTPEQIRINPFTKQVRHYEFSCSTINYNFHKPNDICFPSVGYIILGFMMGDKFQLSTLNLDTQEVKAGHLYISGLISNQPAISRHFGQGNLYAMKLHPVIGYYLLKEMMCLMTDKNTFLSNIIGKEGQLLHQLGEDKQITSFDNNHFVTFLHKHLPDMTTIQRDPIYHAVNMIIWKKGMIRVRDLASKFCMSERTLNRQFLLKVGLSPKAYAKIWQWQYVTQLLQTQTIISLEELAFKTGYFDASHLAHDFKDKILQTPSEFRQTINPLIKDYLNFPVSMK